MSIEQIEFTDFHLFGAVGGGAKGFKKGAARLGNRIARFRCLGSIDVDAAACRAFERNIGVKATALDLFDRDQYTQWHGHEPPADWREATVEDVQRAAGYEAPDVGFLSAPCKGFSGLLPESSSLTPKYQALNRLTLRGIWLWLEAFKHQPTKLLFFENVPRIATRGRYLLDQIISLLRAYGYAVHETTHDCGKLGNLAQSRKRFLLVARHMEQVEPFMYEPPQRPLMGVGTVLDRMMLPGDPAAGPMHRVPNLQWQTWVRLAFVRAGCDWRSLNDLAVENGFLRDYVIIPESGPALAIPGPGVDADMRHHGFLGVNSYSDHMGTISSRAGPSNGNYAVADPKVDGHPKSVQLGVRPWDKPAGVVTSKMIAGGGPHSVADIRLQGGPRFSNAYRIARWPDTSTAVTSARGALAAIADPRPTGAFDGHGKYRVTGEEEPSGAVIAGSTTGQGAFAVADTRTGFGPNSHRNKLKVVGYDNPAGVVATSDRVGSGALSVADPKPMALAKEGRTNRHNDQYGVVGWDGTSKIINGHAKPDNSAVAVADPRPIELDPGFEGLPDAKTNMTCVIRALDDTWHRPFTTLELAALQSLYDPEDPEGFWLEGTSDSARREWIGNAVPPDAAEAMANVALETLLAAQAGVTFKLSSTPIWVRQVAIALSVRTEDQIYDH